MKKNLVLGMAKGYDWTTLEPFVTSFARNCPSAELVLFVDDLSDFSRDRLISCVCGGVKLERCPAEINAGIPNSTRWKVLADFLDEHSDNYAQVLCIDTRDSIFQSDVFAAFADYKNYLGYATEDDDIRGSKKTGGDINYRWVANCFSKDEADKLADKKIICSGTVIGTSNEMKLFCREMWKILEYKNSGYFDQAVMNHLVYNNLLPIENMIEIDVVSGAIFTNGIMKNYQTRDEKILRGDGGVPAVVHQYDRHPELVRLVDKIYRDRNFQGDERFTDPRSVLEQVKQLLYLGKPDEAARFFMNAHDANFGNNANVLLNLWGMLLNYPFVPAVGYLELSVQGALASAENLPVQYLNAICSLLIHAIKNRRAVNPRLLSVIAGGLMNIAEQSLNASNQDFCFFCIDAIKSFDLPPNKDFCLLQAKAYRTFGRKDEALEAYQKALDLS